LDRSGPGVAQPTEQKNRRPGEIVLCLNTKRPGGHENIVMIISGEIIRALFQQIKGGNSKSAAGPAGMIGA
jgi:hypothetical protein